jgi:hypothetical protein
VGRLHRTHVHVGVRAGRRRLQIDGDQLLVREQIFFCFITFIQDSGAETEEEHCSALTRFQDQYANIYTQ